MNGRESGTPSCLICSASMASVQRNLHPPNPANEEIQLYFLQFVAGAAHHKCFMHSVSSPPLNEYACKPCFGKFERDSVFS